MRAIIPGTKLTDPFETFGLGSLATTINKYTFIKHAQTQVYTLIIISISVSASIIIIIIITIITIIRIISISISYYTLHIGNETSAYTRRAKQLKLPQVMSIIPNRANKNQAMQANKKIDLKNGCKRGWVKTRIKIRIVIFNV